jgi:hypothetical protein
MKRLVLMIAIAVLHLPAIAAPTPTPPKVDQPPELNSPDSEPKELQSAPTAEDNPFISPNLDDLIEKKISEDVWSDLKGDLPCSQATGECIHTLQASAVANSRLLKEIDQRVEEAIEKIEEARQTNLQSISIATFSPFLQAYIGRTLTPIRDIQGTTAFNPLTLLTGNLLGVLGGQFFSMLFPWQDQAMSDASASRAIAIGDLQLKIAELQRTRAEIADKLREKVVFEALELENKARDFQIQQELGKRDHDRLEILKVGYRFGEGTSESYLNQISAYERQKAIAWRTWAALRSQLTKVRLLVLGDPE